ncbi:hypothetical protein Hoch_1105 [Haliangium ochraceum DSM 14365]|uniref:DUF4879 domain-containing protein n=1 Tax=Haliangium ochraceum (strain DSM 14365 / JCM 11303 / SMP-2) TaxID=502025 RepID=D0LRZ5_HALO1|nr:hypothetical protein Hoch_1105 [Haliangium ochraceum DSM 14365]
MQTKRIFLSTILLSATFLVASAHSYAGGNDTSQHGGYEVGDVYRGDKVHRSAVTLPRFTAEELENIGFPADDEYVVEAPAPGITYFQIVGICSSYSGGCNPATYTWESIDAYQTSTVFNHGGSIVGTAVLEYGYGNGGANLGGVSGSNYDIEYLCGSMSNLHSCSTGETVTGFLKFYSFSGPQGGSLSANTSSIAYPFGFWSDSLYIL